MSTILHMQMRKEVNPHAFKFLLIFNPITLIIFKHQNFILLFAGSCKIMKISSVPSKAPYEAFPERYYTKKTTSEKSLPSKALIYSSSSEYAQRHPYSRFWLFSKGQNINFQIGFPKNLP